MAEEGEQTPQQEAQEAKEEQEDELHPVSSSMVAEVGYDPEGEELLVVFNNGKEYSYLADRETYQALLRAPSVGRFLWDGGYLA